jgi:hypothetical protein
MQLGLYGAAYLIAGVLSVPSLDSSQALPADIFRRHARSPKGHLWLVASDDGSPRVHIC